MHTKVLCRFFIGVVALASLQFSMEAQAGGPERMNYQGFLRDDGGLPVTDPVDLEFTIYDAETGGTALWTEAHAGVTPTDGIFSVILGSETSLTPALFEGTERWIETSVDGAPLVPRRQFLSAPYALRASVADVALAGGEADNDWTIDGTNIFRAPAGRVGVGTNEPGSTFHIMSQDLGLDGADYPSSYDSIIEAQDATLALYSDPSGIDGSKIALGEVVDGDITDLWYITHKTSADGGALAFQAGATGVMRLTREGNVGIGTESPATTLHVMGEDLGLEQAAYPESYDSVIEAQDATLALYSGPSGLDGSKIVLGEVVDGEITDNWYIIHKTSSENGDLSFQVNSTEAVRFTSGGDVGIGTSTPTRKLDVQGDVLFNGEATIFDSYPDLPTVRLSGTNENGLIEFSEASNYMAFRTGSIGSEVERFRVVDSGVEVSGTTRTDVLQITGGADLAEPFDVAAPDAVIPGMVLSIDATRPGRLKVADRAYDRMVAGIASGARGVRAGITLQQEGTLAHGSVPVALSGRVYCLVDATYGAVGPGDLLTTSDTPGHAMRVSDPAAAQGAVIGKAMTSLEAGRGHVLVLVNVN